MDELIIAIKNALCSGNYFGALFVSVTLPDICAALESSDGTASRIKYIAWYDRYVPEINGFRGVDAYRFRCRLLHQGTARNDRPMNGERGSFVRYLFTLRPLHADGNQIIVNGVSTINLDLENYCNRIMEAAQNWLQENISNQTILTNLEQVVRTYDNPLAPHINIPGSKGIY